MTNDKMKIAIVDYGMGNLQSVYNAFISLGADAKITSSAEDIKNADKLILPGVGSFGDCIKGLEEKKLIGPIKDFVASGKPYLGLCLGLQILFEKSEEGNVKGLGLLKGNVRKFKKKKGFKIPHMGWNTIKSKLNSGEPYFYFVHSYYVEPKDKSVIAGTTEYAGIEFASMIKKDNITAVQFHPEKSQDEGLEFLGRFIKK